MIQIFDHAAQAVARIFSWLRDSLTTKGEVQAFATPAQEIETAFIQLEADRNIQAATGDQLDRIGKMVGAPDRGGLNDADYLVRVNAQIRVNVSQGKFDDIVAVLLALHPTWTAAAAIRVVESYATNFNVMAFTAESASGLDTGDPAGTISQASAIETARFMGKATASGVRSVLLYREPANTAGLAFSFAGPDQELGFGDGMFVGAIEGKK